MTCENHSSRSVGNRTIKRRLTGEIEQNHGDMGLVKDGKETTIILDGYLQRILDYVRTPVLN